MDWSLNAAIRAAVAVGMLSGTASAKAFVLQPEEAQSQDVFVYEFLPLSNFDGGSFGAFLAVSETSTGHDTRTLIDFDLSEVNLDACPVESATLNLYVIDGFTAFGGVFANPSETVVVQTEVHTAGEVWDEGTVTWATMPPTVGNVVDVRSVDGIDQWVSFDVTDLVGDWLSGDVLSNGFVLVQSAEVVDPESGLKAGTIFDSSAGPNRPFLEIVPQTVPGDFDHDCDVDLVDYASFWACVSGPWQAPDFLPPSAECLSAFDAAGDGDVDVPDYGVFQGMLAGGS